MCTRFIWKRLQWRRAYKKNCLTTITLRKERNETTRLNWKFNSKWFLQTFEGFYIHITIPKHIWSDCIHLCTIPNATLNSNKLPKTTSKFAVFVIDYLFFSYQLIDLLTIVYSLMQKISLVLVSFCHLYFSNSYIML